MREIKEMDECEKWKLTDLEMKVKQWLYNCLFSVKSTTFAFFNKVGVQVALCFQEASSQNDNLKLFNDFIILSIIPLLFDPTG